MRGSVRWVVGGLCVAVLISGCGTSSTSEKAAASHPTPSCALSPLTGTCTSDGPVLIVKVDDVREARPQFHLNEADLVLVEPVEGGLTRLFVVYNSTLPDTVGPIRSARITDTDLVPAFGHPLFAYSGSQQKLVPYLQAAPMQRVGAPQGGIGYRRLDDRPAPHNYVADVPALLTRVADTATAHLQSASYWRIGKGRSPSGAATSKVVVHWPASEKTFIWDAPNAQWTINVYNEKLMTQVDTAGTVERAHATNVVIMQTSLQSSEFRDKFGATTPYPRTTGEGEGIVLEAGKAITATWTRSTNQDLPHWFDSNGNEIALRPGNTWWLIVTDLRQVALSAPAA